MTAERSGTQVCAPLLIYTGEYMVNVDASARGAEGTRPRA